MGYYAKRNFRYSFIRNLNKMNTNNFKVFAILLLLQNMFPQLILAQLIFRQESINERYKLSTSVSKWVEVYDGEEISENEMNMATDGDVYLVYSGGRFLATSEIRYSLCGYNSGAVAGDMIIDYFTHEKAIVEGLFFKGKKEGYWKMKRFFKRKNDISDYYTLLEENYKEGVLHGVRRILSNDGLVIYSTIFIEGTGVYCEYYAGTKQLIFVGYMTNGKRDGCWEYYSRDGNCIRKENYKNGVLHGKFEVFNNIGDRIYQTDFMNGTGFYKTYNEYGEITAEGKMENNFCVGSWKRYKYLANSGNDSRNRITRWYEYGKDSTNSLEELDERTIATYYIDDIPFYIRVSKK